LFSVVEIVVHVYVLVDKLGFGVLRLGFGFKSWDLRIKDLGFLSKIGI